MACKQVKQAAVPKQNALPGSAVTATQPATPAPAPAVAQPAATAETSAPIIPATTDSLKITPGAKVYITPMDGFENYLAAAFGKKKVPLIPVFDPNQAGTSVDKKAGWAKIAFMGNIHSDNAASISMADKRTGAIVYAYAVDKKSTMHGQQTTAEACAKHLKSHIEGHE